MAHSPQLSAALRRIAGRASLPLERLEGPFQPDSASANDTLIQAKLEQWTQAISAQNNREALRRFLEWEGLDMAAAERAVGPVLLLDSTPLPAWAETLGNVLAGDLKSGNCSDLFNAGPPLPFQDLLAPFILVFRRRLVEQAGSAHTRLSPQAHTALERGLLARLVSAAAQTFYAEFQVARATGMSPLARFLPQPPDALYRGFVERLQNGELLAFFLKYPVLARLLAALTEAWTEAHVEFLQRLEADLPDIARTLGDGQPGCVTTLQTSLSDFHRGGRSAIELGFDSGLHLIYKPKDLGTEAAYNQLLLWLNAHGAPLDLRPLKVLNRSTHGWVEFVEHNSCADEAAVARYYRRAGALLCLVYALEGTDCHGENLIACGEYPVLVDAETLLHPRVPVEGAEELLAGAQFQAYTQLDRSVLRTGLLPSWQTNQAGDIAFDISGLGAFAHQVLPYRAPRWKHVNTDQMTLAFEQGELEPRANIPHVGKTPARLEENVEDVVQGFESMYRFLLARRQALLAADGPLGAFRGQTARFVFRATKVYSLIQKQALQPERLRDGVDYGLALEKLARAHLLAERKPSNWPILRAERQAMQCLDIPFFTSRTDSDAVELDGGEKIPGYFAGPGFDSMLQRVEAMNETDMSWQAELIRAALHVRVAGKGRPSPVHATPDAAPLGPDELAAHAVKLARELHERAIWGRDGSMTWIAPQYTSQSERFQLSYMRLDLYDGLAGVALFLAALEAAGEHLPAARSTLDARRLSLAALQAARQELKESLSRRKLEWLGLGGASGLGSLLYAMTRIGQWLNDSALLEEARAAVQLLTPEDIAADAALDIIAGSAGTILGLLAVHAATRDALALERAADCGRHLCRARVPSAGGPRAWATLGGQLLTGFAHGAAGIAYALLRLYAATGAAEFRAAAQEAIEYETSVFVEPQGNWPDLRPDRDETEPVQRPKFMAAWCHGAPGIGLARLGGLPWLDTPAIRQDIEIALAATQRVLDHQHLSADHVCCGNIGRIEFLLAAGLGLNRPDLLAAAGRQAARVIARAEHSGSYHLAADLPRSIFSPGFFQGAAGIGYHLLRLACPDRLPSVLLWE